MIGGVAALIKLNRINAAEIVINVDLIESLEETPDVVITLICGKKFVVSQNVDEIISRAVEYKARILRNSIGNGGAIPASSD